MFQKFWFNFVVPDERVPPSTEQTGSPPEIVIPEAPMQILAPEGTLAEFDCLARGSPEPIVTWEKDGYQVCNPQSI